MPERNILQIFGYWSYIDSSNMYEYHSSIYQETGRALNLQTEVGYEDYIIGIVSSILNRDGEIIQLVNAQNKFKVYLSAYHLYGVIIPKTLIYDYGVREYEYIDVIFTEIQHLSGETTPLFPKILRYGEIPIKPKAALPYTTIFPEILIERQFKNQFYSNLVYEINVAYGYGLTRSTLILYRTLLENLLIELLRSKFGMKDISFFFDKAHSRFHDFSILVYNLKHSLIEFKPYSAGFNADFFTKLEKYKDIGNASTHRLEIAPPQDFFTSNKKDMTYISDLIADVVTKISGIIL